MRKHSHPMTTIVAILGLALMATLTLQWPAGAARITALKIGIAPSPNGYVMEGVPTQVAIAGTPKAIVSLWDASHKKWFRMGTATPAEPLAYTFTSHGVQKLRVAPKVGPAKVVKVAVYFQQHGSNQSGGPQSYGNVVMPTSTTGEYFGSNSYSAKASEGCVFLDLGITVDHGYMNVLADTVTASVKSTGAPPVNLTATRGAPAVQLGIPVKGDVVVDVTGSPQYRYYDLSKTWTCLNDA